MLHLLILVIAVSSAYSIDIKLDDKDIIDKLPAEIKLIVNKIKKEYGGNVSYVCLSDNDYRYIQIFFNDQNQSYNLHCNSFFKAVKAIEIDDNDSSSIKKAVNLYEKKGQALFKKAGFINLPEFSLKLDRKDLFTSLDPLTEKDVFNDGTLDFIACFNEIEIDPLRCSLQFKQKRIDRISFVVVTRDKLNSVVYKPEIRFRDALQKHLSSSNTIALEKDPEGKLCYLLREDDSFKLCWRTFLQAGNESRMLWLNALSGHTEEEYKTVKLKFMDEGKFDELPEERKLKIRKIVKEIEDVATAIYIWKTKKHFISLNFDKEQSSACQEFINALRDISINENDSAHIEMTIEAVKKEGQKLFDKLGYPNRPGFSFEIDKKRINDFYSPSLARLLRNANIYFHEYYNGIEIECSPTRIILEKGKIKVIGLAMFTYDDVNIAGLRPDITFEDALQNYLSSSKIITLEREPTGHLCYLLGEDDSLKLCWKINIEAGLDFKWVWINALSGKTEQEIPSINID